MTAPDDRDEARKEPTDQPAAGPSRRADQVYARYRAAMLFFGQTPAPQRPVEGEAEDERR